jgi:hypothetical protein
MKRLMVTEPWEMRRSISVNVAEFLEGLLSFSSSKKAKELDSYEYHFEIIYLNSRVDVADLTVSFSKVTSGKEARYRISSAVNAVSFRMCM